MSDEHEAAVVSIFGEVLIELINKDREIGRDTLALSIKDKAENEEDEEKIFLYWQACRLLAGNIRI